MDKTMAPATTDLVATYDTRYGHIRALSNDLPIAEALQRFGEWAQLEIDFLCSIIDPGSTVLDLGAHIGCHTLAFSNCVGESGKVCAFEPQAPLFSLLEHNVRSFARSPVELFAAAVGDGQHDLALPEVSYTTRTNFGAISLTCASSAPGWNSASSVRTLALDDLPLVRCDLVKIDTEGHELAALRGARQLIGRHAPIFFIEVNSSDSSRLVLEHFKGSGYSLYLVGAPSFNPNNYGGAADNPFGAAMEAGLLAVPESRELREPERYCPEGVTCEAVQDAQGLADAIARIPRYRPLIDSISRLEGALEAARREVVLQKAEQGELAAKVVHAKDRIDTLYSSRSWRMTAPLRAGASWYRALGSRVKSIDSADSQAEESEGGSECIDLFKSHVERAEYDGVSISVSGWAFHPARHVASARLIVHGRFDTGSGPLEVGINRQDVYEEWGCPRAEKAGFAGMMKFAGGDPKLTVVEFRLDGGEIVRTELDDVALKRSLLANARVLMSQVNAARLRKTLRAALRGDLHYIRHRIQAVLRHAELPALPAAKLEDALVYIPTGQEPPGVAPRDLVDLVIPVFNGGRHLRRLLPSIMRNTDLPCRLIIVDDASNDEDTRLYLEQKVQEFDDAVLLRNKINVGFVESVNRGASQAAGDFVILTTDVEVPPGWLSRLIAPIRKDRSIASTTPFTNSGTICSFPNFLEDNDIFAGLTCDQVDTAFRSLRALPTDYIELPSGVGFCMGVNGDAWEQIGGLDAETFGRGYAEENDWSLRAVAAGFRNILVHNLFVFHEHGGTFESREKQVLMERHLRKLNERYPYYTELVDQFIQQDRPRPIRNLALMYLATRVATARATLIIDHNLGGGANSHRKAVVERLVALGEAALLVTCMPYHRRSDSRYSLECRFRGYSASFEFASPEELEQLFEYLPLYEIVYNNLVFFPEPLRWVRFLSRLKDRSDARLCIVMHDFFPICPSYQLLSAGGSYCGVPNISKCRTCLPRNRYTDLGNETVDIADWRDAWEQALNRAASIECVSESTKQILGKAYPLQDLRVEVSPPHGLPKFHRGVELDYGMPLTVGVVGAIGYGKGSRVVGSLAQHMNRHEPGGNVVVIGSLQDAPLVPNLTVTGPYEREELPTLLERYGVNVVLFPSIWPETYSYVVAELMELRVPVCCFDLGAPAERLRDYPLGSVIDEGGSDRLLSALADLKEFARQSELSRRDA